MSLNNISFKFNIISNFKIPLKTDIDSKYIYIIIYQSKEIYIKLMFATLNV